MLLPGDCMPSQQLIKCIMIADKKPRGRQTVSNKIMNNKWVKSACINNVSYLFVYILSTESVMLDGGWLRTTCWHEDSYKAQNTKHELRNKRKNSVFLASTRSSIFPQVFFSKKNKRTKTFAAMRQTFSSGDSVQASMLFY